jgi:hypothetical protein
MCHHAQQYAMFYARKKKNKRCTDLIITRINWETAELTLYKVWENGREGIWKKK